MASFSLMQWEEVTTPPAVPVFPEPQTETCSLGQPHVGCQACCLWQFWGCQEALPAGSSQGWAGWWTEMTDDVAINSWLPLVDQVPLAGVFEGAVSKWTSLGPNLATLISYRFSLCQLKGRWQCGMSLIQWVFSLCARDMPLPRASWIRSYLRNYKETERPDLSWEKGYRVTVCWGKMRVDMGRATRGLADGLGKSHWIVNVTRGREWMDSRDS